MTRRRLTDADLDELADRLADRLAPRLATRLRSMLVASENPSRRGEGEPEPWHDENEALEYSAHTPIEQVGGSSSMTQKAIDTRSPSTVTSRGAKSPGSNR